jgi:DNA polymerase-1
MKKILVVDGNSIINRAYYGMRPLTTKSGKSTHAVYGMINIIWRQISELSPDYTAVAFDLKAPTFRHKLYEGYKAGRHPTPEDLLSQFPDAKECLKLLGITVLELEGYEADDIQGTVAKMAHRSADTEAYILSGDRDLLQLIDGKVTVLLATNSDTKAMRREEFTLEYGISPESFVDMKALMGDSSDNIPGVAGIGKKTAAQLIQSFNSLEGIYENIEDKSIKAGVREKLKADRENAFLSRTLAKINTEVPLGITLEDISYKGIDREGLYRKFTELELNSLITKFKLNAKSETEDKPAQTPSKETPALKENAKNADPTPESSAESTSPSVEYLSSSEIEKIDKKRLAIEILNGFIYIFDGFSCYRLDEGFSFPTDFFNRKEIICHEGKSLWHRLRRAGLELSDTVFYDLQLYAYVLNPGAGAPSAASLASGFIGKTPLPTEVSVHLFFEIEEKMREKIIADGLEKILFDIEIPLLPVLGEIEEVGFMISPSQLEEYGDALETLANDLTSRIYIQAGREFNVNSPKQLGEVLFEELGLHAKKKKTKTGYSTDAETLEELRTEHPIVDDVLEYRQVTKLLGTYARALPEAADSESRIHTDFKQALTATGRLSSADPNLQNIPIRTKMGRELRRSFISKEGYTLVDADYSQIELRLLAHISDDYNMCEAFRSGEDIHRKTAAAVFGMPEEYVTDEMRKRAKAVNFGIVYGISGFSLAKDIGTSVSEATKYIKNYLFNYPFIDKYLEDVVALAKEQGYTSTIFGRRRYIPELSAQNGALRAFGKRVAMNAPIQGAAADIMKLAMLAVYRRIKREGLDAKIVMQVHDELILEVRDDQVELAKQILCEEMEGVVTLSIPLTVDVTTGKNWLEQL